MASPARKPASTATAPRQRPTEWLFASSDFNVLVTGGHLLDQAAGWVDGAKFELENGIEQDVYIEHPSLLTISSTIHSQRLHSINSGTTIFSVPLPLTPGAPVVLTLHKVLASTSKPPTHSLLWSKAFNVLLDGEGFPLPRFESTPPPSRAEPPSVLSPGLRAFSPSASVSRGRSSSIISSNNAEATTSRGRASSLSTADVPTLRLSKSRSRAGPSSSPTPHGLLAVLVSSGSLSMAGETGTSSLEDLQKAASSIISTASKETAEAIAVKRREHEAFVERIKREVECLESRIEGFSGAGPGKITRGFSARDGSASRSRERGVSASRDSPATAREKSRGRQGVTTAEEQLSARFVEEEEDDDRRGRSPSRDGRRHESKERKGKTIQATVDDEDAEELDREKQKLARETAAKKKKEVKLTQQEEEKPFVPHSLGLIVIPEMEELELPPTPIETKPDTPDVERDTADDSDIPFDMDEDLVLPPNPPPHSSPPAARSPSLTYSPPLAPTTNISQSFDPRSFNRASALSSSFAQLLRATPSPGPAGPQSGSPPDVAHGNQTSAKLDALTYLRSTEGPRNSKAAVESMRIAGAEDAPSHRTQLARRRGGRKSFGSNSSDVLSDGDDMDDADIEDSAPANKFVVGSLPISIGPIRGPGTLASSTLRGERELMRKTSVPAKKEGMLVPKFVARRRNSEDKDTDASLSSGTQNAISPTLASDNLHSFEKKHVVKDSARGTAQNVSGLGQSLANPPSSFGGRADLDDETGQETDSVEDSTEGSESFVPPHVLVQRGEEDGHAQEDLMGRSIYS